MAELSLLAEAKGGLKALRKALKSSYRPNSRADLSKNWARATYFREILLHRIVELGEQAIKLVEAGQFVSCVILGRAVYETVAVMYLLDERLKRAVKDKDERLLDDMLLRSVMGSRNDTTEVKALNITKAIDRVTRIFKPFKEYYAELCEFTHPNYSGCFGCYAEVQDDGLTLELGPQSFKYDDHPPRIGVGAVAMAAKIGEHYYTQLEESTAEFRKAFP